MIIDKAHRAFASLRNIASENFETQPDTMQNFELNLNTAMHELHTRSERVQELEADITAVKKEMEMKMTIISGLTRERSSMKASPMDMSVVSSMRDQLLQSENQLKLLHESHASREQELQAELESLRGSMSSNLVSATSDGERALAESDVQKDMQNKKIAELEAELADWEVRHQTALKSMEESEEHLLATISELESQLASMTESEKTREVDAGHEHDLVAALRTELDEHKATGSANAARVAELEQQLESMAASEKSRELDAGHEHDLIATLRNEIAEHKAAVAANATRVAELEAAHAVTRAQLDEVTKSRDMDLEGHKTLIAQLEQKIADHESIVRDHQESINLMKLNHSKELDDIVAATEADHEAHVSDLILKHQADIDALEVARDELRNIATQVAFALGVDVSIEKLQERIADLLADQKSLSEEIKRNAEMKQTIAELSNINDTVMKELEGVKAELASLLLQTAVGEKLNAEHATVSAQLAALKQEMHDLETKNKKNSRLVEELEDQLATNFDLHQTANNRLSTLQTERNAQLEEANAASARAQSELAAIKEEYSTLQVSLISHNFKSLN